MTFTRAGESVEAWLDRIMEARAEAQCIRCPYCNHAHECGDFDESTPVSYWGDDAHELMCHHCEREFTCIEKVERTYETKEAPDAL